MSKRIPGCNCGLLTGYCPVHAPAADFDAAIARITESRESHQRWADFLEEYPDHLSKTGVVAETIQTRAEHEKIVAEYDNVLRCLASRRTDTETQHRDTFDTETEVKVKRSEIETLLWNTEAGEGMDSIPVFRRWLTPIPDETPR